MQENIKTPTGNILILEGEKGNLECLSLGDYGREQNVKADFLGLNREIAGVPNGKIQSLIEKWVITISTQYGCSMGCKFCDVPKVGIGKNATLPDLTSQVIAALKIHPEIEATKRLNLHYARMGEPTFNNDVLLHAKGLLKEVRPYIGRSLCHPVVSTMLPKKNKKLFHFLQEWCDLKNYQYRGCAGLQFSINSTSDSQREMIFNGNALSLYDISLIGKDLPQPKGRKYALNFALADNTEIDASRLAGYFSPDKFMIKITPMHVTAACKENNLLTTDGYFSFVPYQKFEQELKEVGFDVLVFVPSLDEDLHKITCGNAILSSTL